MHGRRQAHRLLVAEPGGRQRRDLSLREAAQTGIEIGYIVGLIGANMILAGGLIRQALGGRTRKPPGVM